MHEIINLQIGEAANYLGTHFWNVQEDYVPKDAGEDSVIDHDVSFRPAVAPGVSDIYTPRALIYDFKSNFGNSRQLSGLYEASADQQIGELSDPTTTIQHQPSIPLHEYQQARARSDPRPSLSAANIRYWSDFNRVSYDPKHLAQINEYRLGPQHASFHEWSHGEELFDNLNREKNLLDDDLRPLIEECDQMSGLHLITSVDDGWSGFASKYMEDISDEYGKTTVLVWGLNSKPAGMNLPQRRAAVTNQARSLACFPAQASLYIPLARYPATMPSKLDLGNYTLWQSSALQCMAMETCTLPTRALETVTNHSAHLNQLVDLFEGDQRQKVADANVRFQPTGKDTDMTNGTSNGAHQLPEPCWLLPPMPPMQGHPTRHDDLEIFGQVNTIRGTHFDEMRGSTCPNARWLESTLAFPVLDSFPALYRTQHRAPDKFSVRAELTKSPILSDYAKGLDTASRPSFGIDEGEAISDELQQIAAAYAGRGTSEDEDDDD